MKLLLDVIRAGVGSAMCASLIVGCADGRGTNGFKSYRYSAEELAKARAELAAKTAGTQPKDPEGASKDSTNILETKTPPKKEGDGTTVTPPAGGQTTQPGGQQTAPAPGPQQDASTYSPISDQARQKLIAERRLPQEPEQQVETKVEDLLVTSDALQKNSKVNESAKQLLKGLTVKIEGPANERVISLDSIVVVKGEVHTAHVEKQPVKFLPKGSQATNLLFHLMKNGQTVSAGTKLYLIALCEDQQCTKIQLRFSFENGNARVDAILVLQFAGEWKIIASNVDEPPMFEEAIKEFGGGTSAPPPAEPPAPAKQPGEVGPGTSQPQPPANPPGEVGPGTSEPQPPAKQPGEVGAGTSQPQTPPPQERPAGETNARHKADQCPAIDGMWKYKKEFKDSKGRVDNSKDVFFMFVRSLDNELTILTQGRQDLVWPVNGKVHKDEDGNEYTGFCESGDLFMEIKIKDKGTGTFRFHVNADGKSGKFRRVDENGKSEDIEMTKVESQKTTAVEQQPAAEPAPATEQEKLDPPT